MTDDAIVILHTVNATCAWAAGLFFLHYWLNGAGRFFLYFGAAFGLLALSWVLLGVFYATDELRPYVYVVRLVAFLFVITAGINQNRRAELKKVAS